MTEKPDTLVKVFDMMLWAAIAALPVSGFIALKKDAKNNGAAKQK